FFNKWNKFDKKYTNLTDEANKKFSETNKPKKDKNFTKDDFAMLKQFVVTDKSITDAMLAPLKYATNLEYFRIELSDKNLKRNINDFYFLKSMPKLKIFYYINQAPDFNLNLKEQLPHIDFSNNRLLEDVRICKTRQADFQFLQGLNLKTVSLQDNEISDISVLENMNNLERIDLDNNKISKLCDFTKLSNLITLYLLDNPISDISNLSSLKNLEALHLRNTNINDISVLKELPKLHRLYIDKNKHLPTNYFSVIKELKTLNGLYVDTINAEEFEWLKDFAIRKAEPATFDEDTVRLFEFQNLLYEFEIPENKISENKFEITNPLKNWDNAYIEQDTDESENPNLAFSDDKIIVTKTSSENEFSETYNLYIENAKHTFGEWDQPASIAGKVTLKFKIITPSISTTETNGLPRIYDLRNVDGKSFVTPVKNQYKDGACRSFASIAALESSILKNEGVTLDLSE
ncbi:MAG: C1 family peptidase, partial [Treponemataceae bacterium]